MKRVRRWRKMPTQGQKRADSGHGATDDTRAQQGMRELFSELATGGDESLEALLAPFTIDEEIREFQKQETAGSDQPLHALPWKATGEQYNRVRTVIDSGAAETVGPPEMAPHLKVRPSAGSERGQHYISASKQRIPNLGQHTLHALTDDYSPAAMTFQIAAVSRPLTSVGELCDSGNVVAFGPKGGFIQNVASGHKTRFPREGGIYVMDLWIKTPEGTETTTFPGRGS